MLVVESALVFLSSDLEVLREPVLRLSLAHRAQMCSIARWALGAVHEMCLSFD